MKYMRRTAGYTWTDYTTNAQIAKELKITPLLDKLLEYERSWIQHVNRMPRNRLPRVMKLCSPTGRRNHGRPLKRLLDTWDRNGSTSGPTAWQIYDDDYVKCRFEMCAPSVDCRKARYRGNWKTPTTLLWRCSPTWAMASFLRFLDHTQRHTTVGRTPLDEWSARRRDLYLTTPNTHNRQTSMPPVGFEPMISAGERPLGPAQLKDHLF